MDIVPHQKARKTEWLLNWLNVVTFKAKFSSNVYMKLFPLLQFLTKWLIWYERYTTGGHLDNFLFYFLQFKIAMQKHKPVRWSPVDFKRTRDFVSTDARARLLLRI